MAKENAITLYRNAGTVLHDAIKTLRTNIIFSSVDEPIKTIVSTSVIPHEGKSTVSIFLAIAMAESGMRTLLVECDCRRPMLQNYLNLRPIYGLIDVLRKQVAFKEAAIPTGIPRLDLLSCSTLANPVEILGSERFKALIEQQKREYDIIILDTPPLGSFIEAAILASRADGTILVMQPGTTEISDAQTVIAQLEKAKARILGVVFNGVEMPANDYYNSDYYYRGHEKKRTKSSKGKNSSHGKYVNIEESSPKSEKTGKSVKAESHAADVVKSDASNPSATKADNGKVSRTEDMASIEKKIQDIQKAIEASTNAEQHE